MIEELTEKRLRESSKNRKRVDMTGYPTLTITESEQNVERFARKVAGNDFYKYAEIMTFFQGIENHWAAEHDNQDISAYFDDPEFECEEWEYYGFNQF